MSLRGIDGRILLPLDRAEKLPLCYAKLSYSAKKDNKLISQTVKTIPWVLVIYCVWNNNKIIADWVGVPEEFQIHFFVFRKKDRKQESKKARRQEKKKERKTERCGAEFSGC